MLKNTLYEFTAGKQGWIEVAGAVPSGGRQRPAMRKRAASESGSGADSSVVTTVGEGSAVGLSQVFDVLRNRRRRDVLRYLVETDEQATISELAETIAARECDKPVAQITSQERKRVYIGLYQGHLPKMDDYGAIKYNQQRGTIDRGVNFEVFMGYLPGDEQVPGTGDDSASLLERFRSLLT